MTATTQMTPIQLIGKNFRWMQLAIGIVCMAMIANLQYGWTLFVDPMRWRTILGARLHPTRLYALRGSRPGWSRSRPGSSTNRPSSSAKL